MDEKSVNGGFLYNVKCSIEPALFIYLLEMGIVKGIGYL